MNVFRKSRDTEGKFALTTLQNPLIDVSSQLELAASTEKRIEERLAAAQRQNMLVSAPVPPPLESARPAAQLEPAEAFAEQKTAQDDESNSIPTSPACFSVTHSADLSVTNVEEPLSTHAEASPAPQSSPRRTIRRSSHRRTAASILPKRELTALERHERKCVICKHHDRLGIEADFLNWCHPDDITKNYQLGNYRGIYRHAQAFGLMQRRSMNIRFAAETILESSGKVVPNADAVLRAVKMCAHLNERGEWHNPPSHVIVSSGSQVNVKNINVVNPPPVSQLPDNREIEILSHSTAPAESIPVFLIDK